MKAIIGRLKPVLITLSALLLCLEGIGLTTYAIQNGVFFYTIASDGELPLHEDRDLGNFLIHPYLGVVQRDMATRGPHGIAAFHGSASCNAIPCYQRDAIFLGVFGDAWATQAAKTLIEHRDLLQNSLNRGQKRQIILIDATAPFDTQIQTTLRYAFMIAIGQRIDAALVISGPNTVGVALRNAAGLAHMAYPDDALWEGLFRRIERLNLGLYNQPGIAYAYHEKRAETLRTWAENLPLAAGYAAMLPIIYYHESEARKILRSHRNEWENVSHFSSGYRPPNNPGGRSGAIDTQSRDAVRDYGVARWHDALLAMEEINPSAVLKPILAPLALPCPADNPAWRDAGAREVLVARDLEALRRAALTLQPIGGVKIEVYEPSAKVNSDRCLMPTEFDSFALSAAQRALATLPEDR